MATLPQPTPSSAKTLEDDKTVWQHLEASAEELHEADEEAGEYIARQFGAAVQGTAHAAGAAADWVGQQLAGAAEAGAKSIRDNQHAVGGAVVGGAVAGPAGAAIGATLGHDRDVAAAEAGRHAAQPQARAAAPAHPQGAAQPAAHAATAPAAAPKSHHAAQPHPHQPAPPIEVPGETVVVTATLEPQPELEHPSLDVQLPLNQPAELPLAATTAAIPTPKPKRDHWWDKVNPFHHQKHNDAPRQQQPAVAVAAQAAAPSPAPANQQLVCEMQPVQPLAMGQFDDMQPATASPSGQVAAKLAATRAAAMTGPQMDMNDLALK